MAWMVLSRAGRSNPHATQCFSADLQPIAIEHVRAKLVTSAHTDVTFDPICYAHCAHRLISLNPPPGFNKADSTKKDQPFTHVWFSVRKL